MNHLPDAYPENDVIEEGIEMAREASVSESDDLAPLDPTTHRHHIRLTIDDLVEPEPPLVEAPRRFTLDDAQELEDEMAAFERDIEHKGVAAAMAEAGRFGLSAGQAESVLEGSVDDLPPSKDPQNPGYLPLRNVPLVDAD